jgi:hypothetical protein
VDPFEDPGRWDARLAKLTEAVTVDDHTQGKASERIAWQPLPSTEFKRRLVDHPAQAFDKKQYTSLKVDLKYVGERPYMHVRGLGKQVDLGDQLLLSEIDSAQTEQRGRDAYGRIVYRSYIMPDTALTRHLVLTAEGYLVVHDELTPGRSMAGWTAGQLWQLYERKAQGLDWFCADDDGAYPVGAATDVSEKTRRMLVRFSVEPGTETGSEEVKQGYSCVNPKGRRAERFFTTFSHRPLAAGQKAVFGLVVLPHDPAEGDPAAVATRIHFDHDIADRTSVALRSADGTGVVAIVIRRDSWEVKRQRSPGK